MTKITFTEEYKLTIETLIKQHVHKGAFTSSAGKQLTSYVDCKTALGSNGLQSLVGMWLGDIAIEHEVDTVGGPSTGADPLIYAAASLALNVDYTFQIVQTKKEHGKHNAINGQVGKSVMLVDDVLTTGSSFLKSLALCEENDYPVKVFAVLVDRSEGLLSALSTDFGIECYSLFSANDLGLEPISIK